jgi:glycerophosphoryl diester phosphodiesterase
MSKSVGEITSESYRPAGQLGVPWVEFDTRQAADGRIVVWHDEVVTDGIRAGALTSVQLARRGIWRLEEILEALPHGIGIDLDVKNSIEDAIRPVGETTAAKVARIAVPAMNERPILLSSFDPALPCLVRSISSYLPLGLLTWEQIPIRESVPTARHLGFNVLAPNIRALEPNGIPLGATAAELRTHVDIAHQVGLQLLAWVAEPHQLSYLQNLGIDAACVDDITAAQAALASS